MNRWALVVLAACGSKAPAPETAGAKESRSKNKVAPPPPPVCVTATDDAASIRHATSDGQQVQYCIGGDEGAKVECFAVDLGPNTFHRLVDPPKATAVGRAHVETTNPKLEVCTSGTCTSLTAKVMPAAATLRAATNNEGTFAVVLLGDAPKGGGYAEVWDVAKTRKAATFRYAAGVFRCGDVAMLDNTIFLSAAQCGQPAARAGLYNLAGRKIANVGGKDFGTYGSAYVQVDGNTWAFLEENANQVVLQDIVKGKVVKTIDTATLFGDSKMGTPGESALVKLGDGRLVVIAGSPATGNLAIVDIASGKVEVITAPVCKG
jgi:hypothetical protein